MNAFDLKQLNDRRKELGMTFATLAQRSRVPLPTVQRILYGNERRPDFFKVSAIAGALGISMTMTTTPAQEFRRQQAERKAQQLVSITQATSSLEAQAVPGIVADLTARTVSELLGGSRLELWKEL